MTNLETLTTIDTALVSLVQGARLQGKVKEVLGNRSAEELNALQNSIFAEAFCQHLETDLYTELSVQKVIRSVSDAIMASEYSDALGDDDTALPHWTLYRNAAKRFVQAFVTDGWLLYVPERKAGDNVIPARYVMHANMIKASIQQMLHDEPTIQQRYIKAGTKHEAGAYAMSAHVFKVNINRAKVCSIRLAEGQFMHRSGNWVDVDPENEADVAKHEQQKQVMQQARIAYATKKEGWHYAVKADFRGRLYYVSGMLNPQAGGVASYILGHDDEVTYDSTASFAQFISVLTGDRELARSCNLFNFTDTALDFYGNVYAHAAGVDCPAKSSFEREVAKQYLMPKAYGSSDETSRERAIGMAKEAGHDVDAATAVVDALITYNGLNVVKDAASVAAEALADEHKQLSWTTPSGFKVTQNYWETVSEEWTTGEAGNNFIPTKITFKEKTTKVKVARTEEDARSAVVAAAANFIQSLDAAFMALVQKEYYQRTGLTIVGVHDSFTLSSEQEVPRFLAIAWEVFHKMAYSDAMRQMRRTIGLPVDADLKLDVNARPLFLDKE